MDNLENDEVVSLPRTWRNNLMRRRELDRSCSLKKWQLKQRSRRWRRRSYCWRTKILNFWRWGQCAGWRCQGTAPKAAVTGSGTFAPCGMWPGQSWDTGDEFGWHSRGSLSCTLPSFMTLPNLRAGKIIQSCHFSLQTDFQCCPKARPAVCWMPGLPWKISVYFFQTIQIAP